MKEQSKIPTSKVKRAAKFLRTGMKVGTNYVKHYTKKVFNPKLKKEELHKANAEDIFEAVSELKGSALKVAQMLSMDQQVLPEAYIEKFTMAQYNAPPLSYPLVIQTFRKHFGKSPSQIFDSFTKHAVNAASMGQVHQAELNGKKLAVKVQYPGVADSIVSDLRMVKMAIPLIEPSMRGVDIEMYMEEVQSKLLEETDYLLELKNSVEISSACSHLPNLFFPSYYPELSCKEILVMDWLEGEHLDEFLKRNPSQELRNRIGQTLWDFFEYQIHQLRKVHADPHPGNFLLRPNGEVGILDFGCVKVIPDEFYNPYFKLMNPINLDNEEKLEEILNELMFISAKDDESDKEYLKDVFKRSSRLLGKPVYEKEFDFGDDAYFKEIFDMGQEFSKDKRLQSYGARGSKHGIYISRTYVGLYTFLYKLRAKVNTQNMMANIGHV